MVVPRPALLVLADGSVFRGRAFGADGERSGEVVFNTAMSGYQEIATDPSYAGQIVTMTCPHIGNYGGEPRGRRGRPGRGSRGWWSGSSPRSGATSARTRTSATWYRADRRGGDRGVDTRRLTRRLRHRGGGERGPLHRGPRRDPPRRPKARAVPAMEGLDLVRRVTCSAPYAVDRGLARALVARPPGRVGRPAVGPGLPDRGPGLRGEAQHPALARGARLRADRGARERRPRRRSSRARRTGCSSPTGRATPRRSRYAIETIRGLLGRVPDLRDLPRPPAARARRRGPRPTSSSSATAGRTTPCGTSRPARSRSPARTTASRWTSGASAGRRSGRRTRT